MPVRVYLSTTLEPARADGKGRCAALLPMQSRRVPRVVGGRRAETQRRADVTRVKHEHIISTIEQVVFAHVAQRNGTHAR